MLLMLSSSIAAERLTGTVVGVADGDTITVLDANRVQHKIRLGGIDAPEKAQPFGQRSKE
jgi:endonuclease YncB( thermonuclease family)